MLSADDTAELLLENMEVDFLPDSRIKSMPDADNEDDDDDERAIVQVRVQLLNPSSLVYSHLLPLCRL